MATNEAAAKALLDRKPGDPTEGWVSETDVKDAFGLIYQDIDDKADATNPEFLSSIRLTGTGSAMMTMERPANINCGFKFRGSGKDQWMVRADTNSNFSIYRYDAAGVGVENALEIAKADGLVTIAGDLKAKGNISIEKPGAALALKSSASSAMMTFDRVAGNNAGLRFSTAGVDRWLLRVDTSDDFSLTRYDDAGTSTGTPLLVDRQTGKVTIASGIDIGAGQKVTIAGSDHLISAAELKAAVTKSTDYATLKAALLAL